ncbi:MAG: hypothetical protein HY721_06840 [Planctomycetes bacterium]|nr:hypothetical protein [Planctomycetota bacterium]
MRPALSLLFALPLALPLGGCATCVKHLCHNINPESTFVTLRSTPPGATAKLSSGRKVKTPARLVLRSDEDMKVTFTLDGYEPAEVQVGPALNPWVLADFIAVPPLGFFVDLEQGATSALFPKTVHAVLESTARAGQAAPAAPPPSSPAPKPAAQGD